MLLIDVKYRFFILFLLVIASCSSPGFEEESFQTEKNLIFPIENNETRNTSEVYLENLSYGENNQQIFDIYLPENRSSEYTKVIVLIHGGSWVGGDKQEMNQMSSIINSINPNYAVVNMNYTLANTITTAFPNQFLELDLLLNALTENSNELQILPEFALIGESAGGQIALMYDYTYDSQDRVKMVCTLGAPTDFTHSAFQDRPDFEAEFDLLVDEDAYPPNYNLTRRLSPALQVTCDSSPTLIFHGRNDGIVPLANARKLKRKLSQHGVIKKLTHFDAGHSNWNEDIMDVVELKLKRFMRRNFPI